MKALIIVLLAVAVTAEQKREAEPHGYGSYLHHGHHHLGIAHHPGHGISYVHSHVGKRAADAEPHSGYGSYLHHHHHHPVGLAHHPVGIAHHPGHAVSYVHSHIGKRDAAAEPEPHRGYGLPYGYLGYRRYGYPLRYGYYGYLPYGYGLHG